LFGGLGVLHGVPPHNLLGVFNQPVRFGGNIDQNHINQDGPEEESLFRASRSVLFEQPRFMATDRRTADKTIRVSILKKEDHLTQCLRRVKSGQPY
jgi:hypothetical protein